MFGRSRGAVVSPLQQISQPGGPVFVAWMGGMVVLYWLCSLALPGCGVVQIQFKIVQEKYISVINMAGFNLTLIILKNICFIEKHVLTQTYIIIHI